MKEYRWLPSAQVVALGLTAPLFLFPRPAWGWAFLAVPALLICGGILRKRFIERTALDWPLALLGIQVLITCLIVPDILFSLPKITGVVLGLLAFYVLAGWMTSEKRLAWGTAGFLGAGALLSLVGLLGMKWDYDSLLFSLARFLGLGLDKTVYHREILPFLQKIIPSVRWNLPGAEEGFNSNVVGGMLILVLPLLAVLAFSFLGKKRKDKRPPAGRLLAAAAAALLLLLSAVFFVTFSIGSWLALAAAVWIVFCPRRGKMATLVVLLALAALTAVFWRRQAAGAIEAIAGNLDREKIESRVDWWKVGLDTIREHPWSGIGLNRIRLNPEVGYERSHLHNHFIHTAAETGLPGLVAYLALLAGAGLMVRDIKRRAAAPWMRRAARGLACGQAALFFFGFTDSIPLGAKVGILFWLSLSLIAALHNFVMRSESGSPGAPRG